MGTVMRCICREGRGIDIWTKSWRMKKNLVYVMNLTVCCLLLWDFPGGLTIRNPPANAGDKVSIPGLGRCPGKGNSNPLQYSCLGNPMDREAWQSTVMGSQKSWTRLSDWTELNWTEWYWAGEGKGNPLQYSSLENSMDREAWQATVCGSQRSRT